MRIEYATLKNFGPHASCEIALKHGLVGIFGRNGSGKSTFVNGIYAALTNDFDRFAGVKADCIYAGADAGAPSFVEIDAEHDGVRFTLRRGLRPNKSSLKIAGEAEIVKAGEIEERLSRDLGVDAKLISAYVFVDQWRMFQFLEHTPMQRAEAFKHLCRTGKAGEIHAALGEMIVANRPSESFVDNSDELLAKIGEIKTEIAGLQVEIADGEKLKLNDRSQRSARDIVCKRQRWLTAVEGLAGASEAIRVMQQQLKGAKVKLAAMEDEAEKLRRDAASRAAAASAARDALAVRDVYEEYRRHRRVLTERLAECRKELRGLAAPEPPGDVDRLAELRGNASVLEAKRRQARQSISIYEQAGSGTCPTCGQEIAGDFIEKCRRILGKEASAECEELVRRIGRIERFEREHAEYLRRAEGLDAQLSVLRDQLDECKREPPREPEGDERSREDLLRTIAEAKAAAEAAGRADRALRGEDAQAVSRIEGNLQSRMRRLAELEEQVRDNTVDDDVFERAQRRLAEHAEAEVLVARLSGILEEKRNRLGDAELALGALRALQRRRRKLDGLLKLAAAVQEVFHWRRLPRLVAQGNLASMEADVNEALGWFGDPFRVETDEELGFNVYLPSLPSPRPADGLSGGQKGVLAIAFRVAVNKLFGTDIGMMWLDEPTSGLDEGNIGCFAEALRRLAASVRDRKQLVVVTHEAELSSSFDQVIEFG